MQITLKFKDGDARLIQYYLRKRYKTRASLAKLALKATWREAALQASLELEAASKELNTSMSEFTKAANVAGQALQQFGKEGKEDA